MQRSTASFTSKELIDNLHRPSTEGSPRRAIGATTPAPPPDQRFRRLRGIQPRRRIPCNATCASNSPVSASATGHPRRIVVRASNYARHRADRLHHANPCIERALPRSAAPAPRDGVHAKAAHQSSATCTYGRTAGGLAPPVRRVRSCAYQGPDETDQAGSTPTDSCQSRSAAHNRQQNPSRPSVPNCTPLKKKDIQINRYTYIRIVKF